ncbi:chaetoglobosin A biosynthesis cluster protein C-like [Melitaea cinxia]|uniref:chaetoglobosin A biosynthesis cluster protein C-like n=1 Tax=Melitaea cinxia TaxID=113334 RepID=UPI001E271C63|nr:chaetoglobosin A biosynthesis cluster protein C-like [Melitaea cinxia]
MADAQMPRNYQRKTETKYKLVDLEKAIEAVRNKRLSIGKAAITYSVPKSTIHDYLKQESMKTPKSGRKAIFSQEQEVELVDHILKCSKQFYGLTIEMVRKIAFKFAEVNNLKHNFDKKTHMAGKDWFYAFKKRNPNISLRRPESTSINRITAFNETEVKMFFNILESLQTKYQFDTNRIYNVDETGISNVQRNSRILAPKGQKQVGMISSGEKGTTITVVCAFSASGNYIPPFFVFKRKRMNAQLLRGGNSDMIAAVSDSGWINENLFVDWITQYEVVELFTKAFNRISNIEKAASGFRAAGIWPLDTTKFDEEFIEATLPETHSIPSSNVQPPEDEETQLSKEKRPITPEAQLIKPFSQVCQLDESIPLQEIVTVPQISQLKTRHTSRKRHSIIITSTPMKDALEEKEQKRKKK